MSAEEEEAKLVSLANVKMTDDGIIFNKRGIGYFISEGSRSKVLEAQRRAFLEEEWPEISRRMKLLGIELEDLK